MPLPVPPPDSAQLLARRRAFGQRLRAARQAADLTQEEVAERAGIDRPAYSEIERGLRDARLSTLLRIESALGAELDMRPAAAVGGADYGGPHPASPNPYGEAGA